MYLTYLLPIAFCTIPSAYAGFEIITGQPLPTLALPPVLQNDAESSSWHASKAREMQSRLSTIPGYDPSQLSSLSAKLNDFLATATYSIPSIVRATDVGQNTAFTTVPDWYSALPTEVRKMKEDVAKAIISAEIAVYGVQGKESGAVSLRGMDWAVGLVLVVIAGLTGL